MSTRELTPVSFVVLGLLARDGPSTAYELKSAVAKGIATFWSFPHSQIYAETEWLASLGLLAHDREQRGRRRRVYRITRAGRAALHGWLTDPAAEELQIRSLGMLKLFLGQFAAPRHVVGLAAGQRAMLKELLVTYDEVVGRLRARGDRPWQLAVGELLMDVHRSMARHWKRIERSAARAGGGERRRRLEKVPRAVARR